MKKTVLFLFALLSLSTWLRAQSSATSVTYNKIPQPALMMELPYNEDISQGFIVSNLKKTGYDPETKGKLFWKQNKVDGFYIFKNVHLEGSAETVDLYFKVESKSRKLKDQSIIYLLVGRQDGSFVATTPNEPSYVAAKNFLNGFIDQSAAYKLDLDIKGQEDVVKKEQKKLDKLQENEKDMIKKIADLQDDLKKNRNDQETQQKTIESEKGKLDTLRTQVKVGG